MRAMKSGVVACLLLAFSAWQGSAIGESHPRDAVEGFCAEEFAGIADARYRLANLAPGALDVHADAAVLDLDASAFHVVTAFEVLAVEVDGDRALARVRFDRVGRIELQEGGGRALLREDARDEVAYRLEAREGRWWVLEPPLPRVGVAALLADLDQRIQSMQALAGRGAISPAQRAYLARLVHERESLSTWVAGGDEPGRSSVRSTQ